MPELKLYVPKATPPAAPQFCPTHTCRARLRLLTRYFRINATERGDAIIEFADPATGWKGKRSKQFTVNREEMKIVGLELHNQKGLSCFEQDAIMLLWLQGIKDLQTGWRWLRDSTTVWYEHPLPTNSCRRYIRISSMPSTFGNWAAPLFAAMYICGYSYAQIAKAVGIDSKNRGTVVAAIKSFLTKKNISPDRVSRAHRRNPGKSTCHFEKNFDEWILVTDSLAEADEDWLRVIGHAFGLLVDNNEADSKTHQ